MLRLAIKILIGDKAKYIGIIIGLSFASLIISQQSGTFLGLIGRTYNFITDTSQPNIWVMDPKVQYVDDVKPMKSTQLYRVKGIEGVKWAVPMYKGLIKARLPNGNYQICNVIGIDNATLIGGPPIMLKGDLTDLRKSDSIIIDKVGAETKLAEGSTNTNDNITPMKIGDIMEINDHYAVIVGICKASRTLQSQPMIYTTYRRAIRFAPPERKMLTYILVRSKKGVDPKILCKKIHAITGLAAYTSKDFKNATINYFLTKTGMLINFGITVLLGFIIGTTIAGQTFYNFTLDNLKYFGTFKAMGAHNKILIKMVLLQATWVGLIGFSIGIGCASLIGFLGRQTELSFLLPWQLFLSSLATMFFICSTAALISIRKLLKLEPAIVFQM